MKDEVELDEFYDDEDTLSDRFMAFYTNKILYALELIYITEIVSIQQITNVPNTKPYILGIINLRGSIIPVVSIRQRFGLNEAKFTETTCIMVVNVGDHSVGLLVDEVSEVVNMTSENIDPPPITNKGFQSKFISGIAKVDGKIITILNINNLLFDYE